MGQEGAWTALAASDGLRLPADAPVGGDQAAGHGSDHIGDFQLVQAVLADMQTGVLAGRAMVRETARGSVSGEERRIAPPVTKLCHTEIRDSGSDGCGVRFVVRGRSAEAQVDLGRDGRDGRRVVQQRERPVGERSGRADLGQTRGSSVLRGATRRRPRPVRVPRSRVRRRTAPSGP